MTRRFAALIVLATLAVLAGALWFASSGEAASSGVARLRVDDSRDSRPDATAPSTADAPVPLALPLAADGTASPSDGLGDDVAPPGSPYCTLALVTRSSRDARAVADADVVLWPDVAAYHAAPHDGRIAARTDVDGRCRVPIPTGDTVVRVVHPVEGGSGWAVVREMPPNWRGAGMPADEVGVVLFAGRVEGRVVECDGRPAPGCEVRVTREMSHFFHGYDGTPIVSGADGRFAFLVDVPCCFELQAWRGRDGSERRLANARPLDGEAPSSGSPVELVMPGEFAVDGVVQGPDGRAAAGVLVSASFKGASSPDPVMSDETGAFVLRARLPGAYALRAESTDAHLLAAERVHVSLTDARPRASVVLRLVEPVVLSGRVVREDRDLDPFSLVVVARPAGGLGQVDRVLLAPEVSAVPLDDVFALSGVHPGIRYDVSVRRAGSKRAWAFVPDVPGDSLPLTLVVPRDARVPPLLRGRVTRACESGVPVVDATVSVANSRGIPARHDVLGRPAWQRPIAVDASGGFELDFAALGWDWGTDRALTTLLLVEAAGLTPRVVGPFDAMTARDPFDVRLEAPIEVEVTVVDAAGRPVEARVDPVFDGLPLTWRAEEDRMTRDERRAASALLNTESGVAKLTDLCEAPVAVRVLSPGFPERIEPIAPTACETTRVRVVVGEPMRAVSVTLVVRGPRGASTSGGTLDVAQDGATTTLSLDPSGRARATLRPGTWTLIAHVDDWPRVAMFYVPPQGGEVVIELG